VGRGKAWPSAHFAELARRLAGDGAMIVIVGGANERALATTIAAAGGAHARDLTGSDLREAILALAACDVAVTNDSGLMHIAAGIGQPTVAIFGPTAPRLWAPLNPLAAALEPPADLACPACGRVRCAKVKHRRTDDVSVDRVYEAVRDALASSQNRR
jgi:heptosyltransferase-2